MPTTRTSDFARVSESDVNVCKQISQGLSSLPPSLGREAEKRDPRNKVDRYLRYNIMHLGINVMPERRGRGPRDRVRTLIRNENLESNFLTLGIRFQFKAPQLLSSTFIHETENSWPSDHEVKNMCLHLTMIVLLFLYKKNYILIKPQKLQFNCPIHVE